MELGQEPDPAGRRPPRNRRPGGGRRRPLLVSRRLRDSGGMCALGRAWSQERAPRGAHSPGPRSARASRGRARTPAGPASPSGAHPAAAPGSSAPAGVGPAPAQRRAEAGRAAWERAPTPPRRTGRAGEPRWIRGTRAPGRSPGRAPHLRPGRRPGGAGLCGGRPAAPASCLRRVPSAPPPAAGDAAQGTGPEPCLGPRGAPVGGAVLWRSVLHGGGARGGHGGSLWGTGSLGPAFAGSPLGGQPPRKPAPGASRLGILSPRWSPDPSRCEDAEGSPAALRGASWSMASLHRAEAWARALGNHRAGSS